MLSLFFDGSAGGDVVQWRESSEESVWRGTSPWPSLGQSDVVLVQSFFWPSPGVLSLNRGGLQRPQPSQNT